LLLVFGSFVLLSTQNAKVRADRALSVGDEFLYQIDLTTSYYNNDSLFVYNNNADSSWTTYYYTGYYVHVNSYVIDNITADSILTNVTKTFYYKGFSDEGFQYLYYNGWYLNDHYQNDFVHAPEYDDGLFYQQFYDGVDGTNISIDFTGYHTNGEVIYAGTETWQGEINGAQQTVDVETYTLSSTCETTSVQYIYDFYYNVTTTEIYEVTFYVDADTGIILECEYSHTYTSEGNVHTYSDELNSDVDYTHYSESSTIETWKLKETTIGYTPVSDASIPGVYGSLVYNYTLTGNSSLLNYELCIVDPSDMIDVEVYVDNILVGSWYYQMSGWHLFSIDPTEIPYYGPANSREVKFVLYDSYNPSHNFTWITYLDDERVRIPEWPCWIEGPTSITAYTSEEQFYADYNIFADTNWTLNAYQVVNNELILVGRYIGFRNSTMFFSNSTTYPGTYYYYFELNDAGGYTDSINLTVTIIEGSQYPPSIFGPGSEIYYYVGDIYHIEYTLYDDDPTYYELYLNDTMILNGTYYDGMNIGLDLIDYISNEGTYELTMYAFDASEHISNYTTLIFAKLDNDPPYIDVSTTQISMTVGDSVYLNAYIYDEHPGYINLLKNNTLVKTFNDWYMSDYNFRYSLNNLPVGLWVFEIAAFDAFGNNASVVITVIVSPNQTTTGTTNINTGTTTTGTGENTLTIAAPGVLISIISLISLSSVVIALRKRK